MTVRGMICVLRARRKGIGEKQLSKLALAERDESRLFEELEMRR